MTSNNRKPSAETVPDWLLERYALGELPQERMDTVRAALAASPDGEARLAALERSNEEILAALPPRVVAVAVRTKAERARPNRSWMGGLALVAVAALALFAVQVPETSVGSDDGTYIDDTQYVGLKGDPTLFISRLRGKTTESLWDQPNPKARAGDRLQLSYMARDRRFGLIASLDGRGVLTMHSGQQAPVQLEPAERVSLPNSYELDDAPNFERFFFIASKEAFDAEVVLDAIRALDPADEETLTAPLSLPDTLEQDSITLTKVP